MSAVTLALLHRYPVKSMLGGGESSLTVAVDAQPETAEKMFDTSFGVPERRS